MPTPREIEQELKTLADEIDRAKDDISRNKGREEALLAQLKKLEIASLSEAQEKIKELKVEEQRLEQQIQHDFEQLKTKYQW